MFAPDRGELQPLKPAAALGAPAAFLCTPEAKGNAGSAPGETPPGRFRLGALGEKKPNETNGIGAGNGAGYPPEPGDAAGAAAGAAGMGQAPAHKLLSNCKAIRMSSKKVLTRALSVIM